MERKVIAVNMDNLKKIQKLISIIEKDGLICHFENGHYYIMNDMPRKTFLLLQENLKEIIVWSYDIQDCTFKRLLNALDQTFDCDIIFPYMFCESEIVELIDAGFVQIDFHDKDYSDAFKTFAKRKALR